MIEKLCTQIDFSPTSEQLTKQLHCAEDSFVYLRSIELHEKYLDHFKPAFILRKFPVQKIVAGGVYIGGFFFKSKILTRLLSLDSEIFVYIATCGSKIGDLLDKTKDTLDYYLLDQLAYLSYLEAIKKMKSFIEGNGLLDQFRTVCPGSLADWSVLDVKFFFKLMQGLYEDLNLKVLDSGLIWPLKSSSGIVYDADKDFVSCILCSMERCENRVCPFEPNKYQEFMKDQV